MQTYPADTHPEETKLAIAYLMDRYETLRAAEERGLEAMRQLLADAKTDPLRASRYRTQSNAAHTRSQTAAREARMVRRSVLALTGGSQLPTRQTPGNWLWVF